MASHPVVKINGQNYRWVATREWVTNPIPMLYNESNQKIFMAGNDGTLAATTLVFRDFMGNFLVKTAPVLKDIDAPCEAFVSTTDSKKESFDGREEFLFTRLSNTVKELRKEGGIDLKKFSYPRNWENLGKVDTSFMLLAYIAVYVKNKNTVADVLVAIKEILELFDENAEEDWFHMVKYAHSNSVARAFSNFSFDGLDPKETLVVKTMMVLWAPLSSAFQINTYRAPTGSGR